MTALVSIIIPAYNAAPWIAETIRSALTQTWPNVELIIIDDGSTDGTLAIAREFACRKVQVVSRENRGAAAARNTGMQEAQGDFIQFLDADDLLEPRKVEIQVTRLLHEAQDCVASGAWTMFKNSINDIQVSPEPMWCDMSPVEWICSLFTRKGMMPIHAWLVPRQVAARAGLWDESLSLNDDREYFTRVVLASTGVRFCMDALSYYRITHQESLSRSRNSAAWESALKVAEQNVNHLLAVVDSPQVRSACATELSGYAISAYEKCPELARQAIERIHGLEVAGFQLPFGGLFGAAARVVGWERALQIKHCIKRLWK